MNHNINNLIEKYLRIKSMGYVKSISKAKNSVGATLESLLGSSGGDFPIPDFNGIEIKAIRDYDDVFIDLFNAGPDGSFVYPTQYLAENFGYPDKDYRNIKVFKGEVDSIHKKKIGLFYSYKLFVDYFNKRIILQIYDYKYNLINDKIYWDFDSIKEKLNIKLQYLAVFTVQKCFSNDYLYFLFNDLKIFELKSFDVFLSLIDIGLITIQFKTGVAKSGKYIGKFQDHGTSFRIAKNNLNKLFNKLYDN